MKIAVTSQNRKLVTKHAGRCRRFWIYSVEEGQVKDRSLLELEKEQSFHDSEADAPHPLDGVDVLLVGGMGPGLAQRLARKGIQVQVVEDTDPDMAVQHYLNAG